MKTYRQKNKEKLKEYTKQYQEFKKETIQRYAAEYHQKHKQQKAEVRTPSFNIPLTFPQYERQYRQKNKNRILLKEKIKREEKGPTLTLYHTAYKAQRRQEALNYLVSHHDLLRVHFPYPTRLTDSIGTCRNFKRYQANHRLVRRFLQRIEEGHFVTKRDTLCNLYWVLEGKIFWKLQNNIGARDSILDTISTRQCLSVFQTIVGHHQTQLRNTWQDWVINLVSVISRIGVTYQEIWYAVLKNISWQGSKVKKEGGGGLLTKFNTLYNALRFAFPNVHFDQASFGTIKKHATERYLYSLLNDAFQGDVKLNHRLSFPHSGKI